MSSRLQLQTLLEEILGSRNVYFQPPASISIKYPAIVYSLDNIENSFADDGVYNSQRKYSITVIDGDPDTLIIDKINSLPRCRFDRHFKFENLNHYVFTIIY
jgi:hypothetical protein